MIANDWQWTNQHWIKQTTKADNQSWATKAEWFKTFQNEAFNLKPSFECSMNAREHQFLQLHIYHPPQGPRLKLLQLNARNFQTMKWKYKLGKSFCKKAGDVCIMCQM